MKFFIDTANLNEIREAQALGVLDGVTTNPSLMAKEGITGKAVTPFLLEHFHTASDGDSLRVNIEIIKSNSALAADIAVALNK